MTIAPTRRTSFVFPKEAAAQLEAIRGMTYIDSAADVIRAALSVYDSLIGLSESHHKIAVRNGNGEEFIYSPHIRFTYPGIERFMSERFSVIPTGCSAKTFFFSGDAAEKLDSIKKKSHLKTNSDVIRAALTSYMELIAIENAGDSVIITDKNGLETDYNYHAPVLRPDHRAAHSALQTLDV